MDLKKENETALFELVYLMFMAALKKEKKMI